MAELFDAAPVWLWLLLAAIIGGLLVLATGPVLDVLWLAWWEFTYRARLFFQFVGVAVVAAAAGWVFLVVAGVIAPPNF